MKLIKLIREGEQMPFFYGRVIERFDMRGTEVAIIPYCWIRRFWYWTRTKTGRFDWEKKLYKSKSKLIYNKCESDKRRIWVRAVIYDKGIRCAKCKEPLDWCDCEGYWEQI